VQGAPQGARAALWCVPQTPPGVSSAYAGTCWGILGNWLWVLELEMAVAARLCWAPQIVGRRVTPAACEVQKGSESMHVTVASKAPPLLQGTQRARCQPVGMQ
jgi:hypothetical protein